MRIDQKKGSCHQRADSAPRTLNSRGLMENNVEITLDILGSRGIMENNMETTRGILGLHRDNGEQYGNYYSYIGVVYYAYKP